MSTEHRLSFGLESRYGVSGRTTKRLLSFSDPYPTDRSREWAGRTLREFVGVIPSLLRRTLSTNDVTDPCRCCSSTTVTTGPTTPVIGSIGPTRTLRAEGTPEPTDVGTTK